METPLDNFTPVELGARKSEPDTRPESNFWAVVKTVVALFMLRALFDIFRRSLYRSVIIGIGMMAFVALLAASFFRYFRTRRRQTI